MSTKNEYLWERGVKKHNICNPFMLSPCWADMAGLSYLCFSQSLDIHCPEKGISMTEKALYGESPMGVGNWRSWSYLGGGTGCIFSPDTIRDELDDYGVVFILVVFNCFIS